VKIEPGFELEVKIKGFRHHVHPKMKFQRISSLTQLSLGEQYASVFKAEI